jgi:hypothetical protein
VALHLLVQARAEVAEEVRAERRAIDVRAETRGAETGGAERKEPGRGTSSSYTGERSSSPRRTRDPGVGIARLVKLVEATFPY